MKIKLFFALLLLIMTGWHVWMTLSLFGGWPTYDKLVNDEPILSGAHPLHQYHGYIGGHALHDVKRLWCYDPHFQAGYPKTPIFDNGCRTAELCIFLNGGEYSPATYKIGLTVLWMLTPVFIFVAAVGAGLKKEAVPLAVLLGLMVAWGNPAKLVFENGENDDLTVGLLMLTQVGLLLQYDRSPGFLNATVLHLLNALGWFLHPLMFALVIPVALSYYLSAGVRHKSLTWHLVLLSSQAFGPVVNLPELLDWVEHWWICSPLPPSTELLQQSNFRSIWEAGLWGKTWDRGLAAGLVFFGFIGLILFEKSTERATAKSIGLAGTGLLTLAILGISSEPIGRMGTSTLFVPSLWFACIPAANALSKIYRWVHGWTQRTWWKVFVALSTVTTVSMALPFFVSAIVEQQLKPASLKIGWTEEQKHILDVLQTETTTEARILWEDCVCQRNTSRWSALLPLLTNRYYVGGLDADGRIEHSHAGFVRNLLAGQPLNEISDDDLREYCYTYNIGWAVLWSPTTIERFRNWTDAKELHRFTDGDKHGVLFAIHRPSHSYLLHGQAHLEAANTRYLTLSNVEPKDGKVVLSFHYQPGMRVVPDRVQMEREPNPKDAIPFIRLVTDQPVAHLTLVWE